MYIINDKTAKEDENTLMVDKIDSKTLTAGHRERVITRFMAGGFDNMADYEKLELILFVAIPRRDVKPLAKILLKQFGSLSNVLDASPQELEKVKQVGKHTIFVLKLFRAAAPLYLEQKMLKQEQLNSGDEVANFVRAKLVGGKIEQLMCMYLNNQNRLLLHEISSGTVDRATVYPRNIVKKAIEVGAVSVIMAHNHPSGNPCPSHEDVELTKQVSNALATVDITLLDHIIVAQDEHISFSGLKLLDG